jgi:prepilin-type N-terminal cleavage/methylation domain-containing protein
MNVLSRVPRQTPRRPRSRRGVSLIELLIVISIGSVIVGTCVTTMHLLLRVERDQERALRQSVILSRVRKLFSDDVHSGTTAALGDVATDGARLTLEGLDGRRVIYSAEEHTLTREEISNDQPAHADQFHFSPGTVLSFTRDESFVRLEISIPAGVPDGRSSHDAARSQGRPPMRLLTIEAFLDRDRRYERRAP